MFARILVTFFILSVSIAQPTLGKEIELPSLGTDNSLRLSPEEEKRLGEAFMRQIRQELVIMEDPEVQEYIHSLGYQLASHSQYKDHSFHFFMVKDPSINAFAGPAGYIGVNAGIVLEARDESELAAVVAHEIAHVAQRHLDRAFDAADKLSLPTAAALLAAIVLGSNNVEITQAAIAATLAANIQSQLNFTRTHEVEADHIGMQILVNSKFDPQAMPRFFERLQQADRIHDTQVPEFLRTHPVTTNRIAESRSRADQFKYNEHRNELQFHLIKAKMRVATTTNMKLLSKRYEAELKTGNYANEISHRYGYTLTLLFGRDYHAAREQIQIIKKKDRDRISYQILSAEIELADGNVEQGLKLFEQALQLNPKNLTLSRYYANALIQHGQAQKAIGLLEPLMWSKPNPGLYQLLAKAQGDLDHRGAAHRALAEYFYLKGYTHTAIGHLTDALKQSDLDKTDRRNIQTRLDQLKEIAIQERDL